MLSIETRAGLAIRPSEEVVIEGRTTDFVMSTVVMKHSNDPPVKFQNKKRQTD